MFDERNTGQADTLTQLQLLLREEHKVRAITSLIGPSQEKVWAAQLESALKE